MRFRLLSIFAIAPSFAGAATYFNDWALESYPGVKVPLNASLTLGFGYPYFSINFGTAIISTSKSWLPA